jgi:hypothetical protein
MIVGYQHMAYQNQQRYMHPDWYNWYKRADGNLAEYAGFLAALAAILVFMFTPDMRMPGFWPFLWLGLVVGLIVWSFLRYWTNGHYKAYQAAYVESIVNSEIALAKTVNLEIGPEGLTSETATDKVFLTWRRYHCAAVEPEHLVLIFEGAVYAVPNSAIPLKALELTDRINEWYQASDRFTGSEKV